MKAGEGVDATARCLSPRRVGSSTLLPNPVPRPKRCLKGRIPKPEGRVWMRGGL